MTINGSDFDAQDTLDLGSLAKLAAFVVAERGKATPDSMLAYQDNPVSVEFQPTISLNINSPGFGNLRASTLTPMVFVALFTLFSVASAGDKPEPSDVKIVNSAVAGTDKCVTEADKSVRDAVALIGHNQWKTLCERAQRLQQGPKLEVDSRSKSRK